MVDEYCWAITQAAGRRGSGWLEFGYQLGSSVYTYIVSHMYASLRLAPDLPERLYYIIRGVSVETKESGRPSCSELDPKVRSL